MARKGTTNLELKGKRFGKLVVVEEMAERKSGHVMWHCVCDCGVEKVIRGASLKSGNTNSCGCLSTKVKKNEKYGKLTAIERLKDDEGLWKWRCLCDCGNETMVLGGNLIMGNTKSCGCLAPINETLSDKERKQKRSYISKKGEISYPTWRRYVERRDNNTCVVCSKKGEELYEMVAHHLDGFDWCEERRVDVDNGVIICTDCHNEFHRKYGTRNNTQKQFEEFYQMKTGVEFIQKEFIKKEIMKY